MRLYINLLEVEAFEKDYELSVEDREERIKEAIEEDGYTAEEAGETYPLWDFMDIEELQFRFRQRWVCKKCKEPHGVSWRSCNCGGKQPKKPQPQLFIDLVAGRVVNSGIV